MDAQDNGTENPFADTLCSLEWIASAMEAARRHTGQEFEPVEDAAEEPPLASGDTG